MNSTAVSDYCKASKGTITLALTWSLLCIGILVVSLRLYLRLGPRYKIGWDDYTAVASLSIGTKIIGIATGCIFTKAIASGFGKHTSCLPPEANQNVYQFIVIGKGLNIIGIGVIKISVCLTLLRIVELAKRRTAQFLWCLLIFVGITHFGLGMLYFLECRSWTAERGSCLPENLTDLASYIIFAMDAVTDLICALIPILLVQRLQMDIRTKLALCGLMSLGVFTAGCAVAKALLLRMIRDDDYTWDLNIVGIWAVVEQFLGIIITSVPMLRPLFSRPHYSFHNWFRIRFNTLMYSSWGKDHSGSSSVEITRSKQQIHKSDSNLRDVEESLVPPIPCHAHSQEDRNHYANPIHPIPIDEEYAKENLRDESEKK